ncbi:ABC transporter ATP-binding protein [Planctomycetota bacterium]
MADKSSLLELKDVFRSYPAAAGTESIRVLAGVCLRLQPADSMAIVGPSGSGKSTLLNIIGGLDRPSAGQVLLRGRDLSQLDDSALAQVRSLEVGLVFQLHHLLPQCSVLENVLVPALTTETGANTEACDRAHNLLERVGLSDRLAHRPGQLSGGERQRVAVARALINRPRLLLADEPTGELDRESTHRLVELLCELNQSEGVALITVTHAPDLAAHMSHVMVLRDGRLVPEEKP